MGTDWADKLAFEGPPEEPLIVLTGRWSLAAGWPPVAALAERLAAARRVRLAARDLAAWDSSAVAFAAGLLRECAARDLPVDHSGLPDGIRRLLALAAAVPPARIAAPPPAPPGVLAVAGEFVLRLARDVTAMMRFTGELLLALGRFATGRARYRPAELWQLIEQVGPRALPIVSLISFLVGTILAYMGAVQLALFGAQIYIANLVGIGMVREIAALMTGIILAGRTGAAFAAQLGTMQVSEEIDALRTLGIDPIEYLVVPRILALVAVVPLLTVYAAVVGMVGGMVVAYAVFDVGVAEYYHQTVRSLGLTHATVGLVKGTAYGAIVAFAGCLRGMQCGRSAQAVGEATTAAVVLGILLITIVASVLTVMFQKLGV